MYFDIGKLNQVFKAENRHVREFLFTLIQKGKSMSGIQTQLFCFAGVHADLKTVNQVW